MNLVRYEFPEIIILPRIWYDMCLVVRVQLSCNQQILKLTVALHSDQVLVEYSRDFLRHFPNFSVYFHRIDIYILVKRFRFGLE